jgi:hypothetical protein
VIAATMSATSAAAASCAAASGTEPSFACRDCSAMVARLSCTHAGERSADAASQPASRSLSRAGVVSVMSPPFVLAGVRVRENLRCERHANGKLTVFATQRTAGSRPSC